MKLSWFVQSGKQGGEDGIDIDTVKKMVYRYAKAPEKMSNNNIDEVKWVIEKNIESIEKSISEKKELLELKESKMVRIQNGIKTISPPTAQQRIMLQTLVNRWTKQLENIKSIRIEELIS